MGGMAVKGTICVNLRRNPRGFMNLLSSMASEWVLIFLLFVDAALSYLLMKFARYCELQTPCLLCSRLDHVIGNEKPEFYQSLLCSSHRMELSSLISCQMHGKLADSQGMCEECLMSFVMHNKLNTESNRLLVSKLGIDLERYDFQGPFLNKNVNSSSLITRTCSCCNKMWRTRSNAQRLLQLIPFGFGTVKTYVKPPLLRLPGRARLSRRDSLKRMKDKISGPITPRRLGNIGADPLSHVGYSELKITSDSESEFPFSDDDGSSLICENTDPKEVLVEHSSGILPKVHIDNLAPPKQTQQASDPGRSLLDQCVQLDVSEPQCLASDDFVGHGLGELNWKQANPKSTSPALSELIPLDDVPPSFNLVEVPGGVLANKPDVHLLYNSSLLALSELLSLNDVPPSSNVVETPVGASLEKLNVAGTSDIGHQSVIKHAEFSELTSTTTAVGCKTDQALNDSAPSMSNDVDPSEGYRLTNSNKGREVSGMLAELAVSDFAKVHEDLKLLRQIFSAHGIDPSLNDTCPTAYGHHDEIQRGDSSSSNGIWVLQKSASMGRNDSGYESLDGNNVIEIEGESVVDTLKQQVDYERRCMSALYKELEEERNASEVAANQAMAMITRLQEEKASLHMEALQYLRMMEEQAEYDMEALQKANNLLAEKEKEMQDLEAELEVYRIDYRDEDMVEDLPGEKASNWKVDNMKIENIGVPPNISNTSIPHDLTSTKISEGHGKPNSIKTSLLDFEGEKLYISQYLKKLERKLHQVSGNGTAGTPRGGYADKVADGVENPIKPLTYGETQSDRQKEENSLSMQKDLSALNGSLSTLEGSNVSVEDNSSVMKDKDRFNSDWQESSTHGRETDLIALENEISYLNDRLEALEADSDFLEHAVNSLWNGNNEGLQFIQEIAHQLGELRKLGIEKRCLSVP